MFRTLKTLFKALLVMSLVAFVGCSFNNLGGTIEGAYGDVLTVYVDTDCTDQGMDRKIVPSDWDKDSEVSDMKLILSGKSRNGKVITDLELTKDGSGKFMVDLTYDVWELTLSAFTTYESVETEVLRGSTVVDLKNGGSKIEFTLSADGLTGNGGISIKGIYADASDAAKNIVVQILEAVTGTEVKNSDGITPNASKDFTYEVKDLPAGEYVIAVSFKNGTADTADVIGYWTESVRVVPGKITDATDIKCGALKTIPDAPANLKVTNVGTPDKNTGSYQVKLAWEDKSKNEDGFRIYVYEYEDGSKPADPTKILSAKDGSKDSPATKFVKFMEDPMRVSGSLLAGSKEVVLSLTAGKIYEFDISAYNIVDESDLCERVASADYEAPATENVAQTMITYNLAGGVLTKGTVYNGTKYVEFKKYSGTDIDLMTIEAPVTLVKNSYPFSGWGENSKSDAPKITKTTGVKNLTVWAQYLSSNEIDFNVDTFANKLDATKVSVKVGDTSVVNGEVAVESDTVVNFAITPDLGDGIVCDVFEIRINNDSIYEGTSPTFAWEDVSSYDSGTYSVEVFAKPSGAKHWHGYHFLLTITR